MTRFRFTLRELPADCDCGYGAGVWQDHRRLSAKLDRQGWKIFVEQIDSMSGFRFDATVQPDSAQSQASP